MIQAQHVSTTRLSWTPFGSGSALSVAIYRSVYRSRNLCLCDARLGTPLMISQENRKHFERKYKTVLYANSNDTDWETNIIYK